MLKKLALTSAIALVMAAPAYAQSGGTTTAPAAGTTNRAPMAAAPSASTSGTVDSRDLIGRNVVNAQNDKVGDIEAVALGPDGKVRNVIVGVGGFLGMGERLVAVDWNQLQVQDGGKRVVLNTTKDQLKAMPEYKYRDNERRGSVFSWNDTGDRSTYTAAAPRNSTTAMSGTATTSSGAAATTGTAAGTGAVNAKDLIGRNVQNTQNDTIGEIESVVLNPNGQVRSVVLGVGGFLGVGEKRVAVDWNQLQVQDNGRKVVMNTTKDQLKALPNYAYPADQKRGSVFTWNDQRTPSSSGTSDTAPSRTGTGTVR